MKKKSSINPPKSIDELGKKIGDTTKAKRINPPKSIDEVGELLANLEKEKRINPPKSIDERRYNHEKKSKNRV